MAEETNTITLNPNEGRIDIVIFPNGGKEIIGRISSDPEVPMNVLLERVKEFVATKQGLKTPQKFTGHYTSSENPEITWGEWEGEISREESTMSEFPFMEESAMPTE